MKWVCCGGALICLVFTRSIAGAPDDVPILTVCEVLSDVERYQGQSVVVVGRSASTEEGTWLQEECGLRVTQGDREFDATISTAYSPREDGAPPQLPQGFAWDKRLLQQKLAQVMRTTQLRKFKNSKYNDHWLAIFGRLETRLPRRVDLGKGRYGSISGFGHLSAAPAELVFPMNGVLTLKAK